MIWWAETVRRTSSASVLVLADKFKALKFNGGHATEGVVVCGHVCVGPVVALGCHAHRFSCGM